MDYRLFFSPVDADTYKNIDSVSSFYKSITVHSGTELDLKDYDAALIGLTENRGSVRANESDARVKEEFGSNGIANAPDEIRRKLYSLKKGTGIYKVIDLGNLVNGIDLDETIKRIRETGEYLIQNNILPIYFGGTHDLDLGQYLAYEGLEKLVTFLNVDAFLDMEDEAAPSRSHIQSILLHNPNFLFHYSHLAYQSYLIESKVIDILEKLYFDTYRIGRLRTNISEMEPVVRNADLISFDLTAIKSADAPATRRAQPFGLTGEEACQLAWYAGYNEKLSSAGFYEYDPQLDDDAKKTASVVATMIWYFVEGFYHRKDHQDFKSNDYLRYMVSLQGDPETITFFKSKVSDKWWMEVPYPEGRERYARNCIVPCSLSDYETANLGEVPDRYINTHAKLI